MMKRHSPHKLTRAEFEVLMHVLRDTVTKGAATLPAFDVNGKPNRVFRLETLGYVTSHAAHPSYVSPTPARSYVADAGYSALYRWTLTEKGSEYIANHPQPGAPRT